MTTAHRPTFDPAKGKEAHRGPAYHQRLLPAHTHLKQRQTGQGGVGGLSSTTAPNAQKYGGAPPQRDLRAELLKAEAAVRKRKNGGVDADEAEDEDVEGVGDGRGTKPKLINSTPAEGESNEEEDPETKRRRLILEEAQAIDADTDPEDKESDDDEEATLLAELAKIKAERAAVRAEEEAAKAAKEAEAREVKIARGNPLLNGGGGGGAGGEARDFGVKRRWDDDVVFRNQGRGTEERGRGKEFVNDLLRSDFHKRFMAKYVR